MLACRQVGSTVLTALAWADRATVFGVTDSPYCGDYCSGNVVQGTKWYRTTIGQDYGTWGFADGASSLYLYWADWHSSDVEKRLSWWVNAPGNGGARCGTTGEYNSQYWEKVIYHDSLAYKPFGPKTNVNEAIVVGGGWTSCHTETYDVEITDSSIATIQESCTGDNIMLACRQVGSTVLTALAWADRATVFGVTDSPYCGDYCSGNVVQGTKWYRTTIGQSYGTWGFADGDSSLYLYYADWHGSDVETRLSFWVNYGGYGGMRCGASTDYNSPYWEKVIYHAD